MIKNLHETVKCVTLDSYGEDVDFVKMDIEGMEHLALAGAKNLLMKSNNLKLSSNRMISIVWMIEVILLVESAMYY
jgi:hypothetical protein